MSFFADDKQHEATPLRQLKATQEGDFAKSFELAIAMQVLGCAMAMYLFTSDIGNSVKTAAVESWMFDTEVSLSATSVWEKFQMIAWSVMLTLLPLMVVCWLSVVVSHWSQTGVVWLPGKVVPDARRMSPGQLASQFFSLQTASWFFIGVPKFFLTIATAVVSCWVQSDAIFSLPWMPADRMAELVLSILVQLTFHVGLVLLISSAADYWLRWLSFQHRIRMTDTEMREESRAQDGDPVVNSQRKSLYRPTK